MTDESSALKKEERLPAQAEVISLYQSQEKIYPRSVFGYFAKWRWVMIWLTQLFFYGVPWLQWGQRQAFLFDLETKRFYIFNLVLYPQDLIYLTALLIISALSLFLFTAVMGRLWCGYTCPQTVYTEIFLWIEKVIEGDRPKRMKLDAAPWSFSKLWTKSTKHVVWLSFAFWTGFTFVGYFTPIRELMTDFIQLSVGPWDTFWVFFYGFATYGNAGFMREQVCKYMCPYARFQSAMFDNDTLIVTYDEARGEPRGAGSRKNQVKTAALGACIDCHLCVQVCPTGIDIRHGLQLECIGCANCIDACDEIMDKVERPRGLIRYSSAQGFTGGKTNLIRLRTILYSILMLIGISAAGFSLTKIGSSHLSALRMRGAPFFLSETHIRNQFQVRIINKSNHISEFELSIDSETEGLLTSGLDESFEVGALGEILQTLVFQCPIDEYEGGFPINLTLDNTETDSSKSISISFIGPDPRLLED